MGSTTPLQSQYYKHGLYTLNKNSTIESFLEGLSDFQQQPFTPSPFIRPVSVSFQQTTRGKTRRRRWDLIEAHDSVAIALYHRTLRSLIIVRQFRPAVYARILRQAIKSGQSPPPLSAGFTYELCAGIVDKDKTLVEICKEEIMEECGFDVPIEAIEKVTCFLTSMGTSGTEQTLFFAELDDGMEMKNTDPGAGASDEVIEVLALPIDKIDDFIFDSSLPKSSGMILAFQWIKERLKNKTL